MSLIAPSSSGRPPRAQAPVAPTLEEWRAMSPQARDRLIQDINISLSAPSELMAEARPHARAKSKALDKLSQYFSRTGRKIYLADEMAVHYPGKKVFVPDILAVMDVEDPGDEDTRGAWVVADEGKGLDLALEIYYKGDWEKDFVDNVETYADLGITEYFIYDRRGQTLLGYRLPSPGVRCYQRIRSMFGRLPSQVLGLELMVVEGRLRLFQGSAELFDSAELLQQLNQMVDDLQRRREEEQRLRESEQAQALQRQRQTILEILDARKITAGDALRAAIAACSDPDTLRRWTVRAALAATDAEVMTA